MLLAEQLRTRRETKAATRAYDRETLITLQDAVDEFEAALGNLMNELITYWQRNDGTWPLPRFDHPLEQDLGRTLRRVMILTTRLRSDELRRRIDTWRERSVALARQGPEGGAQQHLLAFRETVNARGTETEEIIGAIGEELRSSKS